VPTAPRRPCPWRRRPEIQRRPNTTISKALGRLIEPAWLRGWSSARTNSARGPGRTSLASWARTGAMPARTRTRRRRISRQGSGQPWRRGRFFFFFFFFFFSAGMLSAPKTNAGEKARAPRAAKRCIGFKNQPGQFSSQRRTHWKTLRWEIEAFSLRSEKNVTSGRLLERLQEFTDWYVRRWELYGDGRSFTGTIL